MYIRVALSALIIGATCWAGVAAPDALAQGKGKGKAKAATRIGVDAVVQAPVLQTMPVIGRFVARQHGVVAAVVEGPIGAVAVDVGDRVEKGQLIASLVLDRLRSNRDLRAAELRGKQAALSASEAQLNLARGEMSRLEKLRLSAAFSKARLSDKKIEVVKYESEVMEAKAEVGRTEANLALAEIDLRDAEIRAPYNGVVAQRHVVAGNYVDVGDKIVTLINDDDLEIEADVPSDRLLGLEAGRVVVVRLDDGKAYKAVIRAVIPSENAMTRTRPVRFIPNINGAAPGTGLAADQSVTIDIPIAEQRDVVTVHKDAVVSRGGTNYVFVVDGNKADKRSVSLGRAAGERFEVLDGLKPGDLVAVKGNERLRSGQKVVFDRMKSQERVKPARVTSPQKPSG